MLPIVFLVSLIVFFLIRLIPGDIIDMMLEHTSRAWGIEQWSEPLRLDTLG